jgi:peptidoglycan/xylan/chitin deacetylase (PgdA/CDA1 family)
LEFFSKFKLECVLFVVGKDLINSKFAVPILKQAISQGYEIANHTMNHPAEFLNFNQEHRDYEIQQCHETILNYLNFTSKNFRAPGYSYSFYDRRVLKQLNYKSDFSRTSRLYTLALNLMFKYKLDDKKRFTSATKDLSNYLKSCFSSENELDLSSEHRLPARSISTVWLTEYSITRRDTGIASTLSKLPFLFHAIDFLDVHDSQSKVPSLRVPLEVRLAIFEKALRKKIEM